MDSNMPAPPRRRRWPLFLATGLLAIGLAATGALLYQVYTLPLPTGFDDPVRGATLLKAADGQVFASRGTVRGGDIQLEALPDHLVAAVLAIEDRRFREHGGIDPRGILRAAKENVLAGEIRQGGSTITQQLVKNRFLTPERSFQRKLQEAMLALWLERRLTKSQILENYLETVYFGAGAYGVQAAARRYFGKPAEDLSLAESAMLAGLIRAPSRLAPTRSLKDAHGRAELVLAAMVETGTITEAQAADARANPAELAVPPTDMPGRGYYADWADGEARRLLGEVIGNFTVETTLDPDLQTRAETVVAHWLAAEGSAVGASQAALVAMRTDGAVLAMVGGRNHDESQFNRAVQARRQPGSLFKLFVYLAALETGMTPGSSVLDAPIRIGDWEPGNYTGTYLGQTTLRTAFAKSLNTAAVRLAEKVGRERVRELARSMGVPTPPTPDPSLALGTTEATLLEITAAYAAVAADAARVEPYGIRAIRGPGAILYTRQDMPVPKPSWPREPMLDLLAAVVESGSGRAAALDRPSFGKTGTTQEHRDAWFVGFADGLVVGVWVGNDDNMPMEGVTGGSLPARIWADFMKGAQPREAIPAIAAANPPPPAIAAAEPPPPAPPPILETTRAEPLPEAVPLPDPGPPVSAAPAIQGVPAVLDTGTLRIGGQIVRLVGVRGERGHHARNMAAYIGARDVTCEPSRGDLYRCEVDGWDLSEAVLFNGGGHATPDAPVDLKAAEQRARIARKGIWGGR